MRYWGMKGCYKCDTTDGLNPRATVLQWLVESSLLEPMKLIYSERMKIREKISLHQMGVHQMGIRAQLLKNIETTKEEMERAKLKAKELEVSLLVAILTLS